MSSLNTTMMRFNDGGRPLFARDNDKHMTPAPSQYKPDRFLKDKLRKLSPQRPTIPNELRFKEYDDEEILLHPGPGQYS